MYRNDKLHLLVTSALFAASITVVTAYMLHIPLPTGGYIHLGDALIYLAACLLPVPCAAAAAAILHPARLHVILQQAERELEGGRRSWSPESSPRQVTTCAPLARVGWRRGWGR